MCFLGAALAPSTSYAESFTIEANQIRWFKNQEIGKPVGSGLIWRGGLHLLRSVKNFGGLSDITFTSTDGDFAVVTDKGHFISGALKYNPDGSPNRIENADIKRLRNSKGNKLPTAFSRDPESIDTIYRDGKATAVRVGFEHLTRVADFKLDGTVPGGAAKEYPIPTWITKQRNNGSIETLCIAPLTSPVAGSTLMVLEDVRDSKGNNKAWLSGKRDGGDLTYKNDGGFRPTGCAFTPEGDLLILSRDIGVFGFAMRLRQISADAVKAGKVMQGKLLLEANGTDVDNMEGIATHIDKDGRTVVTLLSDDNFRGWERTLLLQFELVK